MTRKQRRPERWWMQLLREVAMRHDLTVEELRGPSRARRVVRARHLAMYVLRESYAFSASEAAEALNRSDHTTALHAFRNVIEKMRTDEELAASVLLFQRLAEKIRAQTPESC